MEKYYFGPLMDEVMRNCKEILSLGTIGLLEEYTTRNAENRLLNPWITVKEFVSFCRDDENKIQYYIQEGIDTGCLMILSDEDAIRLKKDPIHNIWIYQK